MRTLMLAAAALSLTPIPVLAQDDDTSTADTICPSLESLAVTVMKAKQLGVKMSDLMKVLNDPNTTRVAPIIRAMILDAYGEPNYSTEEFKATQRHEFSQRMVRACYEELLN